MRGRGGRECRLAKQSSPQDLFLVLCWIVENSVIPVLQKHLKRLLTRRSLLRKGNIKCSVDNKFLLLAVSSEVLRKSTLQNSSSDSEITQTSSSALCVSLPSKLLRNIADWCKQSHKLSQLSIFVSSVKVNGALPTSEVAATEKQTLGSPLTAVREFLVYKTSFDRNICHLQLINVQSVRS